MCLHASRAMQGLCNYMFLEAQRMAKVRRTRAASECAGPFGAEPDAPTGGRAGASRRRQRKT